MIALVIAALLLGQAETESAPECPETEAHAFVPGVAPVAGEHPIWLAGGGTGGFWERPECPMKTLWVVARDVEGDLVVTGSRLDGPGKVTFQGGQGQAISPFVIEKPSRRRGVTHKAPKEVFERYAFWPGYVYYPSMGCWELRARIGESEVRIVQHLKTKIDSDCGLIPEPRP